MNIHTYTRKHILYFLSYMREFGHASLDKLSNHFLLLQDILVAKDADLIKCGIRNEQILAIKHLQKHHQRIFETYQELEALQIQFITREESIFPKKLRMIPNPPFFLFVKGKIPEDKRAVAIVGSREASNYGIEMAEYLGFKLASAGVDVISGMALGIDTAAHRGALKGHHGKTYAVLGNGLNICYPKENYILFEQIHEKGGILSEYMPNVSSLRTNFPIRNRLIAGLSDITIIIEARISSGSLITAGLALEQGRDVYALPGRITDPLSLGTNRLIADGAGIITSPSDILDALDILYDKKIDFPLKNTNFLANHEKKVYSCLDLNPMYIEDIIHLSQMERGHVLSALLTLELDGYITQVSSNYYSKKVVSV